jgi:hypothetical protein
MFGNNRIGKSRADVPGGEGQGNELIGVSTLIRRISWNMDTILIEACFVSEVATSRFCGASMFGYDLSSFFDIISLDMAHYSCDFHFEHMARPIGQIDHWVG